MISSVVLSLATSPSPPTSTGTCRDLKAAYQGSSCCGGSLDHMTDYEVNMPPPPPMGLGMTNPCYNMRETINLQAINGPDALLGVALANSNCTSTGYFDGVVEAAEQSGTNVTRGYVGSRTAADGAQAISTPYYMQGLCPVNVHWHLGAEHLSMGQFDEHGTGPSNGPGATGTAYSGRRMSGAVRGGFQCHHYDDHDPQFTTEYDWKYCVDMHVGETYEIHWPHSAIGMCGTPWQYQSPFYDGVFCRAGMIGDMSAPGFNLAAVTSQSVGVQGQIFTIVNNESYYYPDLIDGMIVDQWMGLGTDISYYTGSTTGTSRNNQICSNYAPITWQVDRKCHMISASSFDKMCKDMMAKRDDMSYDLHAHGAREVVLDQYAADNHATMDQTHSYWTGR
jgi:hypothetical protein